VPTFLGLFTDVGHAKFQVRIDRVQQRRLAHPTLSDNDALLAAQHPTQPRQPEAGFGAEQENLVAHLAVHTDQRLNLRRIAQIDLVDADDRPQVTFLGAGNEAVDQVWFQARLGEAADNQRLVDVGNQDVLPTATGAGQCA